MITNSIDEDGNLTCECPICEGQNIKEVFSELWRFETNKKPITSILNDFSKIHEVFASTHEFEVSRQNIKEDTLNKYFKEKMGLKEYVNIDYQTKLAK